MEPGAYEVATLQTRVTQELEARLVMNVPGGNGDETAEVYFVYDRSGNYRLAAPRE